MPKPNCKHVTYAGTGTVVLGSVEREEIAQSLVDRGFDQSKAARFADAANRSAVFAYELLPKMSTPGESQRWYSTVLKAIERNDIGQVRQLLNESADEFEGRRTLERQLSTRAIRAYTLHAPARGGIVAAGRIATPQFERGALHCSAGQRWPRLFEEREKRARTRPCWRHMRIRPGVPFPVFGPEALQILQLGHAACLN